MENLSFCAVTFVSTFVRIFTNLNKKVKFVALKKLHYYDFFMQLIKVTWKEIFTECNSTNPVIIRSATGVYLFKLNKRKSPIIWEICSKLTIMTLEGHQRRFLVSLLLTLNSFHVLL